MSWFLKSYFKYLTFLNVFTTLKKKNWCTCRNNCNSEIAVKKHQVTLKHETLKGIVHPKMEIIQ